LYEGYIMFQMAQKWNRVLGYRNWLHRWRCFVYRNFNNRCVLLQAKEQSIPLWALMG
jgi:hypothetical protein